MQNHTLHRTHFTCTLEVTIFIVFTMRYRELQDLQLRIQSKQSTQCFISHCPPKAQTLEIQIILRTNAAFDIQLCSQCEAVGRGVKLSRRWSYITISSHMKPTWLKKLLRVKRLHLLSLPTPLTMSTLPRMRPPNQGSVSNMIVLPAKVLETERNQVAKFSFVSPPTCIQCRMKYSLSHCCWYKRYHQKIMRKCTNCIHKCKDLRCCHMPYTSTG